MVATAASGGPLRIVFFGTPQFAVPTLQRLIASRHTVAGVVTQPDRPRGRGQKISFAPVKSVALDHALPVFQPADLKAPDVKETLAAWEPDLGVVAAYGKLIPSNLLALPPLGMVNVHASLLPTYRGAAPVHRAVINGDTQTGVTIMRVVRALDAGNMIAKVTHPIGPDDTSDAVERQLADLGADLLVRVVDDISAGTSSDEPQDETQASYASRLHRDEGLLDWSLAASAVHNRVRGLHPWPHAYTYLEGARLILLRTAVLDETTTAPPGTVTAITRDAIHVATGHGGVIAIRELQPEGRKAMGAREFLAGRPLQIGATFGAASAAPD